MSVRLYGGTVEPLSDDEVAGIAISAGVKRDGCEWVPSGIDLTAYKANPVILRDHNPGRVVGAAAAIGLTADGDAIAVRIQFAPAGSSGAADEARTLAKSGYLRGISAGINILDAEPLGGAEWGIRVLSAELLEISLVAIPADQDALVTARSFKSRQSTLAMLRSLPRVSSGALERVFDRINRPALDIAGAVPLMQLTTSERMQLYRDERAGRSRAVSVAGIASEVADHEQRRRRLEALKR